MKNILSSFTLTLALLAFSFGAAYAQEVTPIIGTIQLVEIQPANPETGEVIVQVTVLDSATGTPTILTISLVNAETLGLINTDAVTGEITPNELAYNTEITIDPTLLLPEVGVDEEEHPVGSALGEFFGELLGVEYDTVMEAHDSGVGFGVITQALWLTNQIGGDAETFNALIEAKQSGDFSGITLADGSTPNNWGAVVKSLKQGENLGSVMSGHANNGQSSDTTSAGAESLKTNNGNGNNANNGKSNGNNGGNGNGNSNGNSKNKP